MTEQETNIRTLQTMLRVIASATNEIPSVIPDGIYGPQTEASVRAFQSAAGLPVTGCVDEETWNDIVTAYQRFAPEVIESAPLRIILKKNTALERGSRNSHVHLVQAMLQALSKHYVNLQPVAVTGVYDEVTEQAVRIFQQLSSLPVTGNVDRQSWNALVAFYRLTAGDGTRLA